MKTKFILFFALAFFISCSNSENSKYKLNSEISSLSVDSVSRYQKKNENPNILPIAGNISSKNNVAESNKSKKTSKAKRGSKKIKSISSKKKVYKSNKTTRVKKLRKTSSYKSTSGYCGHPNKTGGNCRRKVKGGGYCWQHS